MTNLKKIIPKDSNEFIADHITHDEIKCRCNSDICTYTLIDCRLINTWTKLRKEWGQPIQINSCYRCQVHNASKAVGGVKGSYHTTATAIDLALPLDHRDVSSFIRLCKKHFPFVKVYRSFLHLDLRSV